MSKQSILFLMLAGICCRASAAEAEFTYNTDGVKPEYFGTSKKETYDVAVCIENPALSGSRIKSLSVEVPGDAGLYTACSAFITTELKIERVNGNRVNVPDIASVDAVLKDGVLTAVFEEGYILAEKPVYVGYSITVEELTEASERPISIVPGTNPNGFWLHSSRTHLKWVNYYNQSPEGIQSAMTIGLEGDFAEEQASLLLNPLSVLLSDQVNSYSFSIINGGIGEITDIDFDWNVGDMKGNTSHSFETPIRGAIGAIGKASFDLPVYGQTGQFPIELTISRINGVPVKSEPASAMVVFVKEIPVMRPLVEEYTGLWCGWCPRGYAVLEYMDEEYGRDTFVAAAWHSDDPMETAKRGEYPNSVISWPLAFIDRDPASMDPGEIASQWNKVCGIATDFNVACEIDYTDDSRTSIKATAHVSSVIDKDEEYRIGYLLVADGLEDPAWLQANSYSGAHGTSLEKAEADLPGRYATLFHDGPSPIAGLVYNDVVINASYSDGIAGSLPDGMAALQDYEHEVTFDITGIKNIHGGAVIPVLADKVRVLAFVLRSDGTVLNSCSSGYPGESSGVSVSSMDSSPVSTLWHDFQGRKITHPSDGIFIKTETMQDGTVKVSKVIL